MKISKFELRDYQKRAVSEGATALLNHQTLGQYPIIQAGTGCWAKGTPVKMADGSTKPIEEISDGDRVLSFDEFSKTITTSTVQSVIKTSLNPKPMIELEYEEPCLSSMQDTNNNADPTSKVSTKAGEKDILLGEVRNKGTATSKVRATFDHPFYDGEGFLPLYQLIWGALEESQRVQLKLLCQQYGQTCDPNQKRRKHSCCNESCPRCIRLLQDSDGRQDCKSPSDCSRELVTESYEVPCSEPHKWGQSRQPSGESGMVHSSIQCMAWLPLRLDKVEPRVQPEKEAVPRGHRVPERVLPRTHRWETIGDKKNRIQQATENVPDRNKRHNPVLVQWRAKVSPAEPYYAIVLEQAPHTYIVGHGAGFLVHNSGKSLIIAGIVNKLLETLPKPKRESECQIVILQPNKELLEQNSDKLAWYGIDNIAVMSASLNRKEAGRVTMATIGTIKSHSPVFQHVKYVLIDECFVAGTKVDGKNIEDIKVGDYVSSYNHVTGKIENKRVRRVIKKPSPNKLYCISTQSGTIISTGNHEYFTQRGYVRADNIVEGDVVYEVSLHDKEIWNRKNLPNMQENSQAKGHEPVSKKRAVCRVKGKNVVLQQSVRENIMGKKDTRPADVATRAWIFEEGERERSCHKEAKRNRQADMGKGCDKSLPQRRERKTTNHLAEDSTRETWSGLDDRTTNSNARTEGEPQVSNMLQSGFRQPMANAGNRAGRTKPQELGSKEEGCQEDCQIKPIRVDGITVLEQGSYEKLGLSDGGNYVYCITVEGNHNFFANGILVHNCDCVPLTSNSQYVKWLQEVGCPPVLGLTATPYKLRSETLREHGQVFVQSAISLLNRFPPIKFNHKDTFFWGKIIYHYELADLMRDKYLAPIKYYSEIPKATLRLNSTGADYIMDDIETFAVNSWNRILHVVMGALTKHPNRILVFCPSVKSAEIICEELQARKVQAEWVCGATPKKERTDKINRFKSGECKVMLNCMCLTAGFDLPELDCIIYARPTLSPRVWIQSLGRGVRLDSSNPDKVLTVYDLVGLCSTIGPVEQIKLRLDRRPNELWSGRGRIDNRSLSKFALKPKLITPPVLNTTLDAAGSRVSNDSVKVV